MHIQEGFIAFGVKQRAPRIAELREKAKKYGIQGYMSMKKDILRKAINDYENAQMRTYLEQECRRVNEDYQKKNSQSSNVAQLDSIERLNVP